MWHLSSKASQDYIHSPQWRQRAAALKAAANWRCQKCGSPKDIQVHHLRYDHLGNEQPGDCIVLCKIHHQEAHGL
jgi:hypothetical protein